MCKRPQERGLSSSRSLFLSVHLRAAVGKREEEGGGEEGGKTWKMSAVTHVTYFNSNQIGKLDWRNEAGNGGKAAAASEEEWEKELGGGRVALPHAPSISRAQQ